MKKNQRKFPRIPEPFEVHCRHRGALREPWHQVKTADLGAGGINIETDQLYDHGGTIELQVRLPSARSPLVLHGRIVRERPILFHGMEYAIEFVDVTPDQQVKIDDLVEFLRKRI